MARGRPRDESDRAGSPPTDRVVAVVELLASQSEPSSVASIASRLDLNRSTVTAILLALERAGWVWRQSDRRYALGAGLIGVAEAIRNSLPLTARFADALDDLAQRAGCSATLAFAGSTELTFLGVAQGKGIVPAGVGVGIRWPLIAPVGAAVIAHRDPSAQRVWMESSGTVRQSVLDDVLSQVRRTGVAVFGLGNADPQVLDVLTEVVGLLAEHPRRVALRQRALELLTGLSGNPYTADELATREDLSVSYLSAPVFDEGGSAVYELQLGVLRAAVSPGERKHYMHEISATAARLSTP